MQEVEVARFESAGDVRRVCMSWDEGRLVIREDVSGPSALVAYGEASRSLVVMLDKESAARLLACFGGEKALRQQLSQPNFDVIDLMELCDREGCRYQQISQIPAQN